VIAAAVAGLVALAVVVDRITDHAAVAVWARRLERVRTLDDVLA
jgi:hypothetical protein